ncbi:Phage P2 GpU [compost metagenome]
MGKSGEAWPLVDGAGRVYGAFVILSLDETQRSIMDNGVPRISDFSLALKRVDDEVSDAEATT